MKIITYNIDGLPESEDERIRKAIHIYLDWLDGRKDYAPRGEYTIRDMIAWLEKQGQVKESIISQHENKMCKENDNSLTSEDERIRKEMISWLKGFIGEETACGYTEDEIRERIAWLEKQGEQNPAIIIPKFRVGDEIKTSDEESLTITKIDEKGYWSEDLFICGFDDAAKWELVEQNPVWSEEDGNCLSTIIAEFSKCSGKSVSKDEWMRCNDFLNSLKDRVQPKQGWSKEDESWFKELELMALSFSNDDSYRKKFFDWLKSLKYRCTWKPSDEQMSALKEQCVRKKSTVAGAVLCELFHDLEKLRGE